jgi:hypothetical protein
MKKFALAVLAASMFAIGVLATVPTAGPENSPRVAVLEDPIVPQPLPPRPGPLA